MKGVVFIQNIVSPYRAHFFNSLNKVDHGFKVFYMGKTEKDRNWDYTKINLDHQYWFDRWGVYFMLFGYHIHLNPVLVLKSAFNKDVKELILAVSYNDLNILALVLLKHLRLTKAKFHFWAEANYLTNGARHDSIIKKWLRKFVYSSADGYFVVPGKMSIDTFEKWGFKNNKYIIVPNTIDEAGLVFNPHKVVNKEGLPVFLMPVRLIEKVKGVLNFFEAIGVDNIKKARFVIAGDGPDIDNYKKYIYSNGFQDYIELKGFCESAEMNQLYNQVDAIILPSFSDPSPLSLVEALMYHLPILCSSHCGNHYEAVNQGKNGFVFSPFNKDEIKMSYEQFLLNKDSWKEMGEVSWGIFSNHFNTKHVIKRFVVAIDS